MKNKIPLFLIVFLTSIIIAIYNFDVISTFVTEWQLGKHYLGKLIFVIVVFTVLFSMALTFIIDWIRKIVIGRKW